MSAAAVIDISAATDQGRQLETKALTLHDQAKALKIIDQPSYDGAVVFLKGVRALRKAAEDHHRPVIVAAHNAHKQSVAALQRIDGPLEIAERTVKGYIAAWDTEQARLRREEEDRLRREEEALREKELEQQIESAEADGATSAEVLAMIDQAAMAPPTTVSAPGTYQPAAGVATRKTYQAQVVSAIDLIKWVAANPQYANLLTPNMTALNQMARAQQGAMRIPGVCVVENTTVAVRQ